MATYVIGNVKSVADPESLAEYRALVLDTILAHGGRFAVRGGEVNVLEGEWVPGHLSVMEFPTPGHARRWYSSPEYQAITRLRAGVEIELVLVHGAGDPP